MARAVARISALIEAPLYPEPSPQLQQCAEVECGQDRGITGQRGHSTGHEMLPCPWQQKVSVGITCKVKHCGTQQAGWKSGFTFPNSRGQDLGFGLPVSPKFREGHDSLAQEVSDKASTGCNHLVCARGGETLISCPWLCQDHVQVSPGHFPSPLNPPQ